ncbi:hypothetical protein [Streptomyces sp. NRRL S-920]|uniref:hypothetical protein n=1 Tax=Streptomyces sp. NRRL S-920 TaxID=1463921 RepID=UPI000A807842|nr:hypothetical protein [Streptomyces sp. NRRL S-920]
MSVSMLAILGAAVAIVTALLLARPLNQTTTDDLRRRFGPEFDRVVARHRGDSEAAERELSERLRRFGSLRVKGLTTAARERYHSEWALLQARFIEAPGQTVAQANALLNRLAAERGFPAESRDRQADALSLHCPRHAHGSRVLHAAAQRAATGDTDTEAMRHAMLAGYELFHELLLPRPQDRRADALAGHPRPHRPFGVPSQRSAHSTRH